MNETVGILLIISVAFLLGFGFGLNWPAGKSEERK